VVVTGAGAQRRRPAGKQVKQVSDSGKAVAAPWREGAQWRCRKGETGVRNNVSRKSNGGATGPASPPGGGNARGGGR